MPSRADKAVPPQPIRTFDEVFGGHTVTHAERAALVWHLAAYRARKTVEALLPQQQEPFDKEAMLGVLREHRRAPAPSEPNAL
jgi:hypothetical protein